MRLSILVVSRTATLVSTMLASLPRALSLNSEEVEILCSWNGDEAEENLILNESGFEFLVANRDDYHFASNMNALADKANGEVLLIINDDVTLDHGSIDAGLSCLQEQPNSGLIGARLRDRQGWLTHAGILFDQRHSPYHQLDRMISSEHHAVMGKARRMPAVTGAAMIIKRDHFQALKLSTEYLVCGEDIEFCLNLRSQMRLNIIYCPQFSGEHGGEATRSKQDNQQGNSEDLTRLRSLHAHFLENASQEQLRIELEASVAEANTLRSLQIDRQHERFKPLENSKVSHWEQQTHALQLARLKLEQKLKQAERGA